MAYTFAEFARLDLHSRPEAEKERCVDCGGPLSKSTLNYHVCCDGARCNDCYFDDLSDLLDKYPIGLPK